MTTRNISELKKAEYNPRNISNQAMAGLVASIEEFGIVDPIIINKDNTIIGGHMRYEVAKDHSIDCDPANDFHVGYKQVPVIEVDLPKLKEKKLNLLLNSQAISGNWENEKLEMLLQELQHEPNFEELMLSKLKPLDLSPNENAEQPQFTNYYRYEVLFDDVDQQNEWFKIVSQIKAENKESGMSIAALLIERLR